MSSAAGTEGERQEAKEKDSGRRRSDDVELVEVEYGQSEVEF